MSGMDPARFDQLMRDETALLNHEEVAMGWHFCRDFDGLLMKVGALGCTCELPQVDSGGEA